jgi:hypothetical protein
MVIRSMALALITFAACGKPKLKVHSEAANEGGREAPLVIVGEIQSDEAQGDDEASGMQLRRLRVRVENVLRGKLADPAITVYYFKFGGGFIGPRPLGVWDGRSLRRVFWLEQDAGVYRTSCDGFDSCTLAIYSGSHPGYRPQKGATVEDSVVDLQLTRGESGVDEPWYKAVACGGLASLPADRKPHNARTDCQ